MRDIFKWDRTTENFFRYISSKPNRWVGVGTVPIEDGKHLVVYIPRKGMDNPPFKELELIVSRMTPEQAATYPYGPAVTEPDPLPIPPGTYEAQIKDVRKIGPKTIAVDIETQGFDVHSLAKIRREDVKTAMHAYLYADPIKRDMRGNRIFYSKTIEERISDLEFASGILFKAVYWILRKMRVVK